MLNCCLASDMVYRWLFLHLFSSVARTRSVAAIFGRTAAIFGRTAEIPSDWRLGQPGVEFSIDDYHNCEKEELCTGNYFSVEEEQGKMILKLGSVDCHRPFLQVRMRMSRNWFKNFPLYQLNCKYA